MSIDASIIELGQWLKTPAGRYVLAWEQACVDAAVADVFGYHALQIGLPLFDALRANRMPHRWTASDALHAPVPAAARPSELPSADEPPPRVHLYCDGEALPLADKSFDLVVLPHTLELARDPHVTLAEVERILVPQGRVMILGFNPLSLWGMRQRFGRGTQRLGLAAGDSDLYLPRAGEFIGYRRVHDWLRLLGFDIEAGRFGCYRPPLRTQRWLDRTAWMDRVGAHWWTVLGAVYFIVAVKRVRGMRLVGLARANGRPATATQPAVAQAQPHRRVSKKKDDR